MIEAPVDAEVAVARPVDAAAAVVAPPMHADAGLRVAPRDAVALVAPRPDAATATVPPAVDAGEAAAPTAAEIAALYTDVGGALRRLSDKKGPEVAEALWQRYRLVRLQSAIVSEQSRREAARTLGVLRKDAATAAQ